MALAKVRSAAVWGIDALEVMVEVDVARGLPGLTIVGLPDKAIDESRERVRSAIRNIGQRFPTARLTINLAPADLKKEGSGFDLAIAVGILIADGQLPKDAFRDIWLVGELALDGELRPVQGAIAIAQAAQRNNASGIIVPAASAQEAALVDLPVYPVENLRQVISIGLGIIKPVRAKPTSPAEFQFNCEFDYADIIGQEHAKRALEIAAAGGHNLLMSGPPGAGKTFLARTLPTILPPLSDQELVETITIASVAGLVNSIKDIDRARPFRSPHHTTSAVALIGGGTIPKPGEITLAHRGVLFLDELPEFPRHVLESLRQPLEDGVVHVSRAHGAVDFPARFQLIAAQNPCPCGNFGDERKPCVCSTTTLLKYQKRVSGPLLDRIDLLVNVPAVKNKKLIGGQKPEHSASIRERVIKARAIQSQRFSERTIITNAEMSVRQLKEFVHIESAAKELITQSIEQFALSARGFHKILKIARTIADLDGNEKILSNHIAEALSYRQDQVRLAI